MGERAVAELLAERISATLTEECLAWGEAINRAEVAKGSMTHESFVELARGHGLRVAQLSAAIAKRLRP